MCSLRRHDGARVRDHIVGRAKSGRSCFKFPTVTVRVTVTYRSLSLAAPIEMSGPRLQADSDSDGKSEDPEI
jgi:hypothetical protein